MLICSYIVLVLSTINLIPSFFMLFIIDDWNNITFEDEKGQVISFSFDTEMLFWLMILKIVSLALMIKWSLRGIKTFKPALKALKNQDIYGINPNNTGEEHSVKTKDFWQFTKKILIFSVIVMIATAFLAREFAFDTVEKFLDQEYDGSKNATTYKFLPYPQN